MQLSDPLTGLRVVRAEILRDWKVSSKGSEANSARDNIGAGIQSLAYEPSIYKDEDFLFDSTSW